jgi:hypothetical protein
VEREKMRYCRQETSTCIGMGAKSILTPVIIVRSRRSFIDQALAVQDHQPAKPIQSNKDVSFPVNMICHTGTFIPSKGVALLSEIGEECVEHDLQH